MQSHLHPKHCFPLDPVGSSKIAKLSATQQSYRSSIPSIQLASLNFPSFSCSRSPDDDCSTKSAPPTVC